MPQIERQSQVAAPMTRMYPRVIGGHCEFCGVLNNELPSTEQYKLCPHFQGMGELRCSYCSENINPEEVVYRANLKIHGHPDNPNTVIVVCDSYNCSQAHIKRFNRSL